MTAISRSKVKIYIGEADAAVGSCTVIEGEIKSYSKSGGEREEDSDAVFGGYIDIEKPISQVEISLEVRPKLDANQTRWDAMAYTLDGTNAGIYTMAEQNGTQPTGKIIYVQATDGTNYSTLAFNNTNVTVFDLDHNADENRTGNITFKFSPTDSEGVSNFMMGAVAAASLPLFSELDNN